MESQLLIRAKKASIELRRLVSNSNLIEQFNNSKAEEEVKSESKVEVKVENNKEKAKEVNQPSPPSPDPSVEMIRIERYRSENDDIIQDGEQPSDEEKKQRTTLSFSRLDDTKQSLFSTIGKLLSSIGEINILCVGDIGSGKSSFILTTLQACGIHRCLPEINSTLYDPALQSDIPNSPYMSLFSGQSSGKRKPHTLLLEPYRPFNNLKILDSLGTSPSSFLFLSFHIIYFIIIFLRTIHYRIIIIIIIIVIIRRKLTNSKQGLMTEGS